MSIVLEEKPVVEISSPQQVRADTLAASVLILLVMTVAQRLIGFGRGIMFCRWLEPEQLGQWDVAFGFLNLAAPLAVLGLPGSFGRYVEYFRQRKQFHTFLRRTSIASLVFAVVATSVVVVKRDWFSRLIFGADDEAGLVVWLALCLAMVIVHNFLISLFISVRMYRFVTALQFIQSLSFAIISLVLLFVWPSSATSVVVAFAVATALSATGALGWLRHLAAGEPPDKPTSGHDPFWAKLLPFAGWMWVTNGLTNLFELVDRYMIIHHSGMAANEALRQVGYYHSSRIVPLLFVAVAGLLGSMITPHLSHDWETGRRDTVDRRLNMMLKMLLISLFAAAVGVLFFAPWLFEVAFRNKFHGGMVVLPWTLAYCIWFGTIFMAQNYLWCAERAGLSSLSLLAGLALNIGLNLLLLPRYGLEGAVWATAAANLAALLLIYLFSSRHGMRVDSGVWILSLCPISLGLGPWVALVVFVVIAALVLASNSVFVKTEKQNLLAALVSSAHKLSSRRLKSGGVPDSISPYN